MSFAITAIGAAAGGYLAAGTAIGVLGGVAAGAAIGSSVSGQRQQTKAAREQTNAMNAARAADEAQAAKAGQNANAARVADRKRRRAAAGLLASTDPAATPVETSVLGSAEAWPTVPRFERKTTLGA